MNIFLLIGLTLIFTACGRFSPEEGDWMVERSETFSNTCGFADEDTEEDTTSNEKDIFVLLLKCKTTLLPKNRFRWIHDALHGLRRPANQYTFFCGTLFFGCLISFHV